MAKIAIAADIHFGVFGKTDDILWACNALRTYCTNNDIEVVIILGDLYHDRTSVGIEILCATSRFFEECSEKYYQQWIVFPGNHDMYLRHSWSINSLLPLRKHLTVIEDVKLLTFDDKRFWVLPFIQSEQSYMKVLKAIEKQYEEGDVLLTHIGVRGSILNTCFLLKDWSHVKFEYSKFKKIYTGHFHSNQQVGDNLWYPGSLIPFKFDEGDIPHGFYVYDLQTETHEFIDIWQAGLSIQNTSTAQKPPPQFRTIQDVHLETTNVQIANEIIRIALTREYTTNEKQVMKDKLLEKGARDVRWMNPSNRIIKSENHIITAATPTRNLFKTWIGQDSKGTQNLDLNLLEKLHDEIVRDGDEMYANDDHEA